MLVSPCTGGVSAGRVVPAAGSTGVDAVHGIGAVMVLAPDVLLCMVDHSELF